MNGGPLPRNVNVGLVAFLLLGMGYLGLILYLGTSSPFLLVRGSSMEPTLHNGDLLINRKVIATELQVGDVIAFGVPSDAQERLRMPRYAVHRIARIGGDQGELVFVTQGDNSGEDPFKVHPGDVKGQVVKNLGPVGRPFVFLANRSVLLFVGLPILTFILIVVSALWLLPGERREPLAEAPQASSVEFDSALNRLADAIAEYGTHLQSHTAVVKSLGGASEGLEQAVQQQNSVLADLTSAVGDLKREADRAGPAKKTGSARSNGKGSLTGSTRTRKKAKKQVDAAPN